MLRVRSAGGRHWLTFKGPASRSRRYKTRQESETELTNAQAAGDVLLQLGLEPVFRYEKYRSVHAGRGRWSGGEVMVDETPIGDFVELEGSPAWIRRLARALGATEQEFITQDYSVLYAAWCRRRRLPVRHMVFHRGRRVST
jgi:adenylate cyclase class 2